MGNEQLVAKLQKVSTLYGAAENIRQRMANYCPPDNYERKVSLPSFPGDEDMTHAFRHQDEDAPDKVRAWHEKKNAPHEPAKPHIKDYIPKKNKKLEENRSNAKIFSVVGAVIAVAAIISFIKSIGDGVRPFNLVVIAVGIAMYFGLSYQRKKLDKQIVDEQAAHRAEYDANVAGLQKDYQDKMDAYQQAYARHQEDQNIFMVVYSDWRAVYLDYLKEEAVIKGKLEADRRAAVAAIESNELAPALQKLREANDMVSEDYLYAIDDLIELIRCGRADSVKEAINLYEEIQYRERQLELEREAEEQRQYEEEQRRADEERRYREDMEFRKRQERARQQEAEAQRAAEDRRHKEEMAQRDAFEAQRKKEKEEEERRQRQAERERQAKEEKMKYEQCLRCANKSHCSMFGSKRPDCSGFRPS